MTTISGLNNWVAKLEQNISVWQSAKMGKELKAVRAALETIRTSHGAPSEQKMSRSVSSNALACVTFTGLEGRINAVAEKHQLQRGQKALQEKGAHIARIEKLVKNFEQRIEEGYKQHPISNLELESMTREEAWLAQLPERASEKINALSLGPFNSEVRQEN